METASAKMRKKTSEINLAAFLLTCAIECISEEQSVEYVQRKKCTSEISHTKNGDICSLQAFSRISQHSQNVNV